LAVSDRTRAVAACTWTVVVARSEDSDGVFGPWRRVPRRWATVWTLVVEVHAVPVGWFFIFIEEKGWHRRSRGTPRDVAAPRASSNFRMLSV
jgi:hypothetical protein